MHIYIYVFTNQSANSTSVFMSIPKKKQTVDDDFYSFFFSQWIASRHHMKKNDVILDWGTSYIKRKKMM
jgi:hypothetical protein